MTYEEWEASVFPEIKNDSLWKAEAYRLGLFASDLGWHDVTNSTDDDSATAETSYSRGRSIVSNLFRLS